MTGAELQRWWIYYQLQPWGETRADLRMAISTSNLVNMWATKPTKPADFIPDFLKALRQREIDKQREKHSMAAFALVARMVGGEDN